MTVEGDGQVLTCVGCAVREDVVMRHLWGEEMTKRQSQGERTWCGKGGELAAWLETDVPLVCRMGAWKWDVVALGRSGSSYNGASATARFVNLI